MCRWLNDEEEFKVERIKNMHQKGRSMVEMLGVLAIIGILSAASLTGYNKAIMKYKLNKQREQITQIVSSIYTNEKLLEEIDKSSYTYLTPILISLGSIPNDMIKQNEGNIYIYDAFQNKYGIAAFTSQEIPYFYFFVYLNKLNIESCINIYQIAKEGADSIAYIVSYNSTSYWGNKECNSNKKCIKDITLEQISTACKKLQNANSNGPNITIYWR